MQDQIKLIIGTRLVLCARVVQDKFTFLRADKDLGDARHMGYDYSRDSNALLSASHSAHWKQFFRCATDFVEPLIIK
jgi:hypothetical protein